MSLAKKILIFILSILLVGCVGINVWYLYIYLYGGDKVVSSTFEVGLQTLADGSDTKYFIEVNYLSNEDGNGVELFEIKFNYMFDENQTAFFSQGLQYVDDSSNMYFREYTMVSKHHSHTNFWGWEKAYWDYKKQVLYNPSSTMKYNYMSSDDYKNTANSTNPINNDTAFKLQLGEDLYLMKFKGEIETSNGFEEIGNGWFYTDFARQFTIYDADRFAGLLFSGVQALKNGTSSAMVWEFGNLFDYYQYNETTGVYDEKVNIDKANLIIEDTKSYYSILVNKSSRGAERVEDSIFNCIRGNSGYTSSDNVEMSDYFLGRTVINVDNLDLVKVNIIDDKFALKLSNRFIEGYGFCSDKISLNILVDLDKFDGEFLGFTKDSGLDYFVVYKCQSVKTIDGEQVYSGVNYD